MQAAPFNLQNIGVLATPLSTQLGRHLAKTGGSYSGSELVTVTVGGNDLFMNLYGVASAAAGGATAVGTAAAAGWDPSVQAAVAAGGPAAVQAATTAAVTAMGQAGAELAGLVKSQVLGKGARYVAVFNLPDVSQTVFGRTLDSPVATTRHHDGDDVQFPAAGGIGRNAGAAARRLCAQQRLDGEPRQVRHQPT